GPVNDVEVHVVDAEALEALLRLRRRIGARGIELGGDEHLVARDAAGAYPGPHAGLVAVGLRGVDVAVAALQRPPHRVLTGPPFGDLPYAQSDGGDGVPVRQRSRPVACAHVASLDCLGATLSSPSRCSHRVELLQTAAARLGAEQERAD